MQPSSQIGSPKVLGNDQVLNARYLERACEFEFFRSGRRLFVDMNAREQSRVIEQAFELQEGK